MKHSNRKYRIKSKFRFVTFLVIVIGLSMGIFGYITGFDISTALTKPSDEIIIEVAAGETLWNIADRYKSENTDIREAVYLISRVNDISDGYIQEGMMISIPECL
ncbi:MAG: LysM peptidoglycan-binding domain-containing protein [Eubacteriales bacterium]|nr:LysM peptidoglycan-binding domain-containing protein [Eubacteriales bacterium]